MFGDRLKLLLEQKKLSQVEFSKLLGVTQSFVSDIVNNKTSIKIETLAKICNILNCSSDWLLEINIVNRRQMDIFDYIDEKNK